jgi:glycosyltransferase involved in cell wall biosynthesis
MDPDRVSTIYNGVDSELFSPRTPDPTLRQELGLSSEQFLVLTVGQIGLRKGQDVLAQAAGLVKDTLPWACYLLAGERCSGKAESLEFERRVVARFQELGAGRFRLLGYRADMPRLMNAADLLVHPAHQEPLGRVLLEAGASRLPIVATDVGGTGEILEHQKSAWLVPPADPFALAYAMETLAGDLELRTHLADNARQRIVETFAIQTAAVRLRAFWRSTQETN